MKTTLGIRSLAVLVLAAGPLLAAPAPEGTGPRGHGAGGGQRLAESLGLSDEQRVAWDSLREQHRAEMEPLRQEGRRLHERLSAALKAEKPDPTAVGAATLALQDHRKKVQTARAAFEERLKGVLDEQQKAKFEASQAAHRSHGRPGGAKGRRAPGAAEPGGTPDGPTSPTAG